jgi:hypothetical protein
MATPFKIVADTEGSKDAVFTLGGVEGALVVSVPIESLTLVGPFSDPDGTAGTQFLLNDRPLRVYEPSSGPGGYPILNYVCHDGVVINYYYMSPEYQSILDTLNDNVTGVTAAAGAGVGGRRRKRRTIRRHRK